MQTLCRNPLKTGVQEGRVQVQLGIRVLYIHLRFLQRQEEKLEEARTCILSKRWSSIWRWRPDVIISKYNHKSLKNNLENFIKSVDDSLVPYAEHNLRIETLCLYGLVHPGLTSHIDRLVNLEKLELLDCEGLEKVEIQAPNLRVFAFKGAPLYKRQNTLELQPLPCTINILDGYETLQILKLEAATMTDQKFEYILSKFSALEVLELTRCYEIKKIKIVSHKIKRFTLCHWKNLKQVDLLTPNLREFNFESGNMCMHFSTMDLSNLKRAKIFFYKCGSYVDPNIVHGNVDSSWYNNLQDFVQKLNYSKCLMQYESILIYEDPNEIIVPSTREIELHITNPLMHDLEKFAYDLIETGPKIISIVPCTKSKMVQVFHKTMIGFRKKQNRELLNEVKGAVEDDGTTPFYSWLKSTPLIERITNFMC
ncbi:hypothetical protein KY285_018221 [Solanum tuberosum]|nr:hypothetical protein KY285_018221 [Solanum tuberosum]